MTELVVSIAVGIALSACSGFRVFIPMLAANLATRFNVLDLSNGFEWLSSPTVTFILGAATLAEIMAYYIPVVDNLLDTITTPASFVAGTILTTSFLKIDSPELRWTLGILAGGGMASTIQAGTGLLRLASTKFTVGFGNALFSTFENSVAIIFSLLTLWLPILVAFLGVLLFVFLLKKVLKRIQTKNK
jgi:hypothetical protein